VIIATGFRRIALVAAEEDVALIVNHSVRAVSRIIRERRHSPRVTQRIEIANSERGQRRVNA
jgi:hypothetical protein